MKKIGFETNTEAGIKKKVSTKVICRVVKNKTYVPWKEAAFLIEFGVGIVRESELVPLAMELGLLKKCTKNKVPGVYIEYPTELHDVNVPLEKNENDLMGVLREEGMESIVEELSLRVKFKMGMISEGELTDGVQPLYVQYKAIEEEHKALMEEVAKLTNSSKWIDAFPLIEQAYNLKPWDKATASRFKTVSEKVALLNG